MLKEQKRHCSSLHANPLFQEFWHRSKPPQDAQPPVIDDLEAGKGTHALCVGCVRTSACLLVCDAMHSAPSILLLLL